MRVIFSGGRMNYHNNLILRRRNAEPLICSTLNLERRIGGLRIGFNFKQKCKELGRSLNIVMKQKTRTMWSVTNVVTQNE